MLQTTADEAYGRARALGVHLSALGLSLGGTMALWLAQTRPIDLVIPVSPFLMPIHLSRGLGTVAMRLLDVLPDQYWWWDPRIKEKSLPLYAYPGYPTHALAQCVFLGNALFGQIPAKPHGRRCTLVTNANEPAVNDGIARELIHRWSQEGATCNEVELGDLGPPRHDIIDPTTFPAARTLVYPRLQALVLSA